MKTIKYGTILANNIPAQCGKKATATNDGTGTNKNSPSIDLTLNDEVQIKTNAPTKIPMPTKVLVSFLNLHLTEEMDKQSERRSALTLIWGLGVVNKHYM